MTNVDLNASDEGFSPEDGLEASNPPRSMIARELWKRIETIHAVTYFSVESTGAAKDAGLRGFWMGYFGFRAAPCGAVSAGAVEAMFANFAPSMVRRSIPDAWSLVSPADLLSIRSNAAAQALRGAAPQIDEFARRLNPTLESVIELADSLGRPLFAANRNIGMLEDPVERLWQNCTTLREHRGDGHVASLATANIDGCGAHLLMIADQGLPPDVFFDNRGWAVHDRSVALHKLEKLGYLDGEAITNRGRMARAQIERTTDDLALSPIALALGEPARQQLLEDLTPITKLVISSGILPFPNPMGLPRLSDD